MYNIHVKIYIRKREIYMRKSIKGSLTVLSAVCALGAVTPMTALADESEAMLNYSSVSVNDAVVVDMVTEEVDALTSDGAEAAATDFTFEVETNGGAKITGYTGTATSLTIPSTLDGHDVIAIGSNAFANNTTLLNVVLPDTVTSIGTDAFLNCTNLASVNLPKGITALGYSAFRNSGLTTVVIPKSLTTVTDSWSVGNNGAFNGCSALKTVTFEEGVTQIPAHLFQNCSGLEKVEIPATVISIGDEAFNNCISLKEVKIADGETGIAIGTKAFSGCSALETLSLSNRVSSIGSYAFYYCSSLKEMQMPDTVTSIGEYAFAYCTSMAKTNLSKGLLSISYSAFRECTSLTDIEIPKSLTTVTNHWDEGNNGIFINCYNLKNVTFEEGVTKICDNMFMACTGLEKLVIPGTVTSIGVEAFENCSNLTEVTFADGNVGVTISDEAFYNCDKLATVKMSDKIISIGTYAFYGCEKLATINLSKSLNSLGYGAFAYDTSLTSIEIPKSLNTVTTYWDDEYNGAFIGCSGLKTVTFENGITQIPATLFLNCPGIEQIEIPATVTAIGEKAFKNCANLSQVVIADGQNSVTIGNSAFNNCTKLQTMNMSNRVSSIGEHAFYNCVGLKEMIMPDTVKSISTYAFSCCSSLETVKLSKGLTSISYGAFTNCTSLTAIEIPKTLNTVITYWDDEYNGVFPGCVNLKKVTLEKGITQVCSTLFMNCPGIEQIEIPATVTTIGEKAFKNCANLTQVVIADGQNSVTIGNSAFNNCTKLQTMNMSNRVSSIGEHAFYNCVGLKEMIMPDTVKSISTYAFSCCSSLETLKLSKGLTSISYGAFTNCTSLTAIEIPKSLTTVTTYWDDAYNGPFIGCSNLRQVTFEKGSTNICNNLFQNCKGLQEIVLPDTITSIGDKAFYCSSVTDIEFPDGLESIGSYAFYDCDNLTKIAIPDTVTYMGKYAFAGCNQISEVSLGAGLTNITEYSLSYCPMISKIVVPYRVTTISKNAFAENTGMNEVVLPRATTSIGNNAFYNTSNLTVYGVSGTYAEEYAESVGATFVSQQVNVTSLALKNTELIMEKGGKHTLIASIAPADFTEEVTWVSTKPDVVSVDNGVLTAHAVGAAKIRVTAGSYSADCTVTVKNLVTDLKLSSTNLKMEALDEVTLTLNISPEDAENKSVAWSSSDENVATVDQNGKITAKSKGTAVITVTAQDDGGASANCNVTVANNAYVCAEPLQLESPHNYENACTDAWYYTQNGAKALNVTFDEQTEIEADFDWLYIYDKEGKQVGKYTGTELAGKTITVSGDTVKIQLASDNAGNAWGFKVKDISIVKAILGDVPEDSWKYIHAQYVYEKGLMNGMGSDANGNVIFGPDVNLTREQFAQILYNAEKTPEMAYTNRFTDVPDGQWYTKAVLWAAENGIVSGYPEGDYGVGDKITREQLAVMLYNYAQYKGYDISAQTSFDAFADASKISGWANKQLKWAVANKIVNGDGTNLNPLGSATRAECAAMLRNFMLKFGE